MSPERQILLLAIHERIEAATSRLIAHEARLHMICSHLATSTAADLVQAQNRVRESIYEVNAWCEVFERESV